MVLAGGTTMVCGGEKCGERTVNNLQGEASPYTQTHSFPHRTLIETFNFTVGLEGQLCLSNLQLYHGQKKCMKWHLLKSVTLGKGTHWSFQIAVRNYPIFFHICTHKASQFFNWPLVQEKERGSTTGKCTAWFICVLTFIWVSCRWKGWIQRNSMNTEKTVLFLAGLSRHILIWSIDNIKIWIIAALTLDYLLL